MNPRREALLQRRAALMQRSAALREQLAQHSAGLSPVLRWVDRGRAAAHWLHGHPLVPLAAVVALWCLKPVAVWRWGRRAWAAWRVVTRVRQKVPTGAWQGLKAVLRR